MIVLRMLMLLLALAPCATVELPCCDDTPDAACCGPAGACTSTATGDCALTAAVARMVPATSPVLEAAPAVPCSPWSPGADGVSTRVSLVPERDRGSAPLYLVLGTLRI